MPDLDLGTRSNAAGRGGQDAFRATGLEHREGARRGCGGSATVLQADRAGAAAATGRRVCGGTTRRNEVRAASRRVGEDQPDPLPSQIPLCRIPQRVPQVRLAAPAQGRVIQGRRSG
jgi:hypothetical protein